MYRCEDIFDEKCGEKKKWINILKKKLEKASSQSYDATSHSQFTYKISAFYLDHVTKNYCFDFMKRKKSEQIYEITIRTKPVLYPTIQLVVILYTKYELSMLYRCEDVFDEKYGEKEKWINIWKNKQEKASSQSHDATSQSQFTYKILIFYLEQLLKNLLRKITVLIARRERKVNKYKEEQVRQSLFSIPRYNLSLLCIPNMNFLCCTVVEISLTKLWRERKMDEYMEE